MTYTKMEELRWDAEQDARAEYAEYDHYEHHEDAADWADDCWLCARTVVEAAQEALCAAHGECEHCAPYSAVATA